MNTPLKAAVIGNPVSHSLSPRLHRWWFEHYGIAGSYDAIPLEPEQVEAFVRGLAEAGFAGVNVTIPYKETVLPFMDYLDEAAEMVGAVNCIVVRDGKLYGRNTDVYGFVRNVIDSLPSALSPRRANGDCGVTSESLKENSPTGSLSEILFHGKKAVVIGAGGAARAIIAGVLGELGARELVIINRTREKGEAIKEHFTLALSQMLARDTTNTVQEIQDSIAHFVGEITVADWEHREAALENAALLVNTSSLGMKGQPKLELDLTALPPEAIVTDIVFNPLETDLLRDARARGLVAIDGLVMLLHQAAPCFKDWFDPENTRINGLPEVTPEQREIVLAGLN